MNYRFQVILPVSQVTTHFPQDQYYFPKPLVEINGMTMISRVLKHYQKEIPIERLIAVIPREWDEKYSLGNVIKLNMPNRIEIVKRQADAKGGLCSSLMAIDHLNEVDPIIIINSDELIMSDVNTAIKSFECHGDLCESGIILFDSLHPRWCYAKQNNDGSIEGLYEKKVISKKAMAGFVMFKNKETFVRAASKAIIEGDEHEGAYYVSAAINQIILGGGEVRYHEIKTNDYITFYNPENIKEFANRHNDECNSNAKVNIIIPAAGEGSRFLKEGWKTPKPMIDVGGKMMIECVIDNLSIQNSKKIVILREHHVNENKEQARALREKGCELIVSKRLTDGTAATVLLAAKYINNSEGLLIANSDQIVRCNIEDMINKCIDNDLDGSIMVFNEKSLNTKWSYAKINTVGLVVEVAEKKAISNLATTGLYYFRKGKDFVEGCIEMILEDNRVNGEYYTCPVYNYLIAKGHKIGVYVIEKEDMNGLGTPEDLKQYLKTNNLTSLDFNLKK